MAKDQRIGAYFDSAAGRYVIDTNVGFGAFAPLRSKYGDLVDLRFIDDGGLQSRNADTAPYWGGAAVTNYRATCTTAFTVTKNSQQFMVTASHCFELYDAVYSPGNDHRMGKVVYLTGDYPLHDMARIGPVNDETYSWNIYVGVAPAGTGASVIGAGDPVVGFQYCVSGSVSYEHCGHQDLSNDSQFCDVDGCHAHLVSFSENGWTGTLDGDSGAPWFIKTGSDVQIRGMHIGKVGSVMYAERWGRIANWMGVTIYKRP